MTIIHKSALLKFPAHQMFALVDDIPAYPQFLPWCNSSRILSRTENIVEAELEIAQAGFNHRFSTRNTLIEQKEIRMALIAGPFNRLDGVWQFTPLRSDACKISLELEFEMSGALFSLTFGAIFNQIGNTMINAFSDRAKALYATANNEYAD
ncbi:type II toxin-antitoxin system RatA family toxin [Candidatus Methylospira mobilis]|uniref:Type II toxin-antitoxin system RatA family toxin n=1 Tax=Candidatus Methylospira mobilis TaxID=1808979 RepID=A0A5Q0BP79_9GAMM|nr:type II toxin-antitoxin system RatA family toxin [Candidatus Methylospira mobilis]QFY43898.1 type II toxin-antitoxin system RatA family toxin [Candidatus Methylospira mobilis]WNV04902.1 type II toxin-antitoxin system RatA family toxin [Candidatus Methylospira mobilis]